MNEEQFYQECIQGIMEMGGKFGVLAELLLPEKVDEHALDFADHMKKKTRIKVLVLVFYFLIYDERN